jgi:RNA polymerase sigma-70 factor (ECF subfamily)
MIPISESVTEAAVQFQAPAPQLEAAEVAAALADLAVEHRTVLLLGVVEGFTCQETADILSVPIGTVMSRLSRARQALRERLAGGVPKLCARSAE